MATGTGRDDELRRRATTTLPASAPGQGVQQRIGLGNHGLVGCTEFTREPIEKIAQRHTIELVAQSAAHEGAQPPWPGSVTNLGEQLRCDGC